jgi:hypothetical protein
MNQLLRKRFVVPVIAILGLAGAAGACAGQASSKVSRTALPLGDSKLTTSGPRKGYLWSCRAGDPGGPGAGVDGPWIDTDSGTWDATQKEHVHGAVKWSAAKAKFSYSRRGVTITTNSLPKHGTTGIYPIRSSDPAYRYDRNPNSISAQSFRYFLPTPHAASSPSCVGGEVGVALNGVAIFDAADAAGRDAVAHEVQDSCDGHPQRSGVYHYHQIPYCFWRSQSKHQQSPQVGWAYDGYPIYGPRGPHGKLYTNANLDACHGTTSKVKFRGKWKRMYHYVATLEYPYTVGCFHGRPIDFHHNGG